MKSISIIFLNNFVYIKRMSENTLYRKSIFHGPKVEMKFRVTTPLELSCTLPPSCFTFFSLYSFRLYLDSVWFASARQYSDPERSSLFLPLFLSFWLSFFCRAPCLFSLSSRSWGPTAISHSCLHRTRMVGISTKRRTSKIPPFSVCVCVSLSLSFSFSLSFLPSLPLPSVQTRQFDSRGGREERGTQHEYT